MTDAAGAWSFRTIVKVPWSIRLRMAYSTGAHSLILITLGNTLFAVGFAPATTVVAAFVVSSAPEEQSGAASALRIPGAFSAIAR